MQPVFAQVKPCPDQHAEKDRKVERFAGAHVGGGCAAKIGCQQDCAENRRTRNHIDGRTDEQEDSDGDREARGISQPVECLKDRSNLHQFGDGVEEQEQHYEGADDASGPETLLRDGRSFCV